MTTTATAVDKQQKGQTTVQTPPAPKTERKPQRHRDNDRFKIFCGSANEKLADDICRVLEVPRVEHIRRDLEGLAKLLQRQVAAGDAVVPGQNSFDNCARARIKLPALR